MSGDCEKCGHSYRNCKCPLPLNTKPDYEFLFPKSKRLGEIEAQLADYQKALFNLREAQKSYMADRGNNEKGKLVAKRAEEADETLSKWGKRG